MPKFLVTSALPYANGPLHLGHLAGAYLPADIFVRFLKLSGEEVLYICGTDEHGVPITMRAEAEGVTPRVIVDRYHELIRSTFQRYRIEFDHFSGTARPAHARLSQQFFLDLLKGGYIEEGEEELFYCPQCARTLADRYVEGTCPVCGTLGARGDECKKCNTWLSTDRLQDPRCKSCGASPEPRRFRHWFLDLPAIAPRLEAWLAEKTWWKETVLNFVRGWIRDGLKKRSITRDLAWGVPVPIEGVTGKVLYVWLDAPIGYISSTVEWAEERGDADAWKEWWQNPDCRLIHFIGKDNIPFHAVTWPATLMTQSQPFVLPFDIPANEHLTLAGQAFSTSSNWAVWAEEALEAVPADVLRWTLAVNAPESKDADFTWEELRLRNNTDLADTYGNLAARTFRFIERYRDGVIPEAATLEPEDSELLARLDAFPGRLAELLRGYQVRAATTELMELARIGNRYFDERAPWETRTASPGRCDTTLNTCAHLLRTLAVLSWPFVPTTAEKLYHQLGETTPLTERGWSQAAGREPPLAGRRLRETEILFEKLDEVFVSTQNDKLRAAHEAATGGADAESAAPGKPTITFADFERLDVRIGRVLKAERVPKASKLLRLEVDLGGDTRQLVAGIAQSYEPEALVGKLIPVLVNLAPATIRGVTSSGMILAADSGGAPILLHPDQDLPPGSVVR